jgi:hypothetical protein
MRIVALAAPFQPLLARKVQQARPITLNEGSQSPLTSQTRHRVTSESLCCRKGYIYLVVFFFFEKQELSSCTSSKLISLNISAHSFLLSDICFFKFSDLALFC